jgi:hypothetical protein
MLYLGSDVPLQTSEWKKKSPGFFLSGSDGDIKKAKRHFTTSYVYYAGSHEGCGCGFFYDQDDDPEDYEIRKTSVCGLVDSIQQALRTTSKAELLVTWVGSEKKAPSRRLEMKPYELLAKEFPLDENDFVILTGSVEQII